MATKNLGKVAITPRGEWVAGTYEKLDLVSYQGGSYLSKKDGNTSAVTVVADWLKVAEKGNKGDQGNSGWQPLLVADTTTIAGKTLLKLQDWIGGQGTKPTTNVGQWQTAAGGYTATAANALDLNAVVTGDVINRVSALEAITQNNTWYGVEWDITVSNSAVTRIGNLTLHQTLPIQSNMRRCLLKDDGSVNYYLDANDSTKKADGTAANLTGTDGQVMVEIPKHYRRFDVDGNKRRVLISEYDLPGFTEIPRAYRSAYEATVDRTVPATPKLSSVVNTTANFRGGNNTAAWDGTYRSLLGKPASNINITTFRTYARNRAAAGKNNAGWNMDLYEIQKSCFFLYLVEYANRNSQLAFNATLTGGYRQGGLGNGVSNIVVSQWGAFNGYNPFISTGITNSLGNNSGVVSYAMPVEYNATILTMEVPSYRGIENIFGHIQKIIDGSKVRVLSVASGDLTEFYTSDNPANFQDSNLIGYSKKGNLARETGYVTQIIPGENMPLITGGGSTTYFCDQFVSNIPASGEVTRVLTVGGYASRADFNGLTNINTSDFLATTIDPSAGTRLTFTP